MIKTHTPPGILLLVGISTLAIVVAACATGGAPSPTAQPATPSPSMDAMESMQPVESMHADESMHFGVPADAADADRTIEIAGTDSLTWVPDQLDVAVGETITFVVRNDGVVKHDFVLGDEHMQDEHAAEMASGDAPMHDEDNVFVLEPGESHEVTWTFTSAGELLFGCHQPGHYESGMVGTITVR